MRKALEFREHAQECRLLASKAQNPDQRAQLIKMAETWESLAESRERMVRESESLEEFDAFRDVQSPSTGNGH